MARDAKDFLNMRVISTDSGRELGKIDQLLFEPGQHQLLGFVIKQESGDPRLFLERQDIRALGHDAVTVASDGAAKVFDSNDEARRLIAGGGHLMHMDVFTEGGDKLGSIDRVMLNDDGTVNSYHTSSGLLGMGSRQDIFPADVVGASEDSIVVSNASRPAS